jgi:hypothetical protein
MSPKAPEIFPERSHKFKKTVHSYLRHYLLPLTKTKSVLFLSRDARKRNRKQAKEEGQRQWASQWGMELSRI